MNATQQFFKLRALMKTPYESYLENHVRTNARVQGGANFLLMFERWKANIASELAIERERLMVEIASEQLAALVRSDFASMDHDGMAQTALSLAQSLIEALDKDIT